MFIAGWLIILILRANDVVVPHVVSFIVGVLAIAETSLYVIAIAAVIFGIVIGLFSRN